MFKQNKMKPRLLVICLICCLIIPTINLVNAAPTQDDSLGTYVDAFSDSTGLSTSDAYLDSNNEKIVLAPTVREEFVENFQDIEQIDSTNSSVDLDLSANQVRINQQWVNEVNISNTSSTASQSPDIAIDTNNNKYIVWREDDGAGKSQAYYRSYDGAQWSAIENVSDNNGNVNKVVIDIDDNDHPYIAWNDNSTGSYEIYYRSYDGAQWSSVTNISNTTSTNSYSPTFTIDSLNQLHFAWREGGAGGAIYCSSNGSQSNMTAGSSYIILDEPSIAVDSNSQLHLAWQNNNTLQTGNGYIDYNVDLGLGAGGGRISFTADASYPILRLDSADQPHIVWEENESGSKEIYYLLYEGVVASGNNLSNNAGASVNPNFVLSASNSPYLVWQDNTNGNQEIYYRYLNGSEWITTENISNNSSDSVSPAIDLDIYNKPQFVWQDDNNGIDDVYYQDSEFKTSGVIQSLKMNSYSTVVVDHATLTANATLNGQTIAYQLSADGGVHWEDVTTGVEHTFTDTGNDLRWRATLTTNNQEISPILNSVNLTITFADQIPNFDFLEDFSGLTYNDTSYTTANWDISAQKAKIFRQSFGANNISNNEGTSSKQSVAIDSNNHLHFAWFDNTPGDNAIYYQYWDGSQWQTLGGSLKISDYGNYYSDLYPLISLMLDTNNYPHLAWSDGGSIYYQYWDGSQWQTLGGSNIAFANPNTPSTQPSLALDANNYPHLAWNISIPSFQGGAERINYQYWDGSQWQLLEQIANGRCTTLLLDDSGYPYINYTKSATVEDSPPEIDPPPFERDPFALADFWIATITSYHQEYLTGYVVWDGQQWSDTSVVSDSLTSLSVSLLLDINDYPHIVWSDGTTINYQYWDGTQMQTSNSIASGDQPYLALDANNYLHFVYQASNTIYYQYWDGSQWQTSDQLIVSSTAEQARLNLDNNDVSYINWYDNFSGNQEVYYRQIVNSWDTSSQQFIAQSSKINGRTVDLWKATLTANDTLNGQTITYQLSADGGVHWEDVTLGVEHIFTNTGNDLRWRANLSTNDEAITPELNQIGINYVYANCQTVIPIIPSEVGDYDRLIIDNTINDQTIRYQILDRDGNVVPDSMIPGNNIGISADNGTTTIDLSGIHAYNNIYQNLKLHILTSIKDLATIQSFSTINNFQAYWVKAKAKGNEDSIQTYVAYNGTVYFDGTSSIGQNYTCTWDTDGDGVFDDATDCQFYKTFTSYGSHQISLRQQQGTNTAIDTDTFTVIVATTGTQETQVVADLTLAVEPTRLNANSKDTAQLTACLFDQDQTPMKDLWINFSLDTDKLAPYEDVIGPGILANQSVLTDEDGCAQTIYTTGKSFGKLGIKASVGDLESEQKIVLIRGRLLVSLKYKVIRLVEKILSFLRNLI